MNRRHRTVAQRLALLSGALLASVALAACEDDDGGGVTITGADGTEIQTTAETTAETEIPTATAEDGTPSVSPAATDTPGATETATPEATETPDATETPTTTPSNGDGNENGEPGLLGVPYSTADVRRAVESAGRTFLVDDEREPLCPDTSVPETAFLASDPVEATGANWAIWVYPDDEALEADWDVEDGQLEPQTDDCELPTGFNYFNANVVMAFISWQGADSESTFDPDRSPREDAAIEAFLDMGTAADPED